MYIIVSILLILSVNPGPTKTCKSIFLVNKHNPELNTRKFKDSNLLRRNRYAILFNNRELQAIETYCKKYNVDNKTKFMRETILTQVLKRFDKDYPTLFEFEKPNLFSG